jgi:hypothetical protein
VSPLPPAAPVAQPMPAQAEASAPAGVGAAVPPTRQPQSVRPAPARPRPQPKIDPSTGRQFNPGDLICGQCGAGNDPSRHFCRRCAASLAQAVAVSTPWWRKIFPKRQPQVMAAGERPKSARGGGGFPLGMILAGIVGLAVLVGLLSYLVMPSLRLAVNHRVQNTYHDVKVLVAPTNAPVVPVSARASSELPGHTAKMAYDGYSNTYWEADLAKDPQPVLTLFFSSPTNLDYALITSGLEDNFPSQPRPKELHIVYSDGTTQDVTLIDQHKAQTVDLKARNVRYMEIHVTKVYPVAGNQIMTLAEIELRRKE